jgi:hypothetical protein
VNPSFHNSNWNDSNLLANPHHQMLTTDNNSTSIHSLSSQNVEQPSTSPYPIMPSLSIANDSNKGNEMIIYFYFEFVFTLFHFSIKSYKKT